MIRQELRRAVLTTALTFVVLPGLLLLSEPFGTAQFAITAAALTVGLTFTVLVILIIMFSGEHRRRDPGQEEHV